MSFQEIQKRWRGDVAIPGVGVVSINPLDYTGTDMISVRSDDSTPWATNKGYKGKFVGMYYPDNPRYAELAGMVLAAIDAMDRIALPGHAASGEKFRRVPAKLFSKTPEFFRTYRVVLEKSVTWLDEKSGGGRENRTIDAGKTVIVKVWGPMKDSVTGKIRDGATVWADVEVI